MPNYTYRGIVLSVPENDSEYKGYFEAAGEGRLVVKKCADCGLLRGEPGPACPWCMSINWEWQQVSGKGTIYSYEIIAHAIQPGFRDFTPYPVVIVDLDAQRGVPTPQDGLRLIANLVDDQFQPEAETNVAIGKRVDVAFQDLSPELSLPQFRLTHEPPAGPVWQFPG
jgi:uncharacterized OB-fold protein